MRIFVDVGAHYGESLEVALDPKWAFDKIFILEPASACQPLLRRFRDRRITIFPFAIGAVNGTATLYGAGQLGGSLYKMKSQKCDEAQLKTELIEVVRASDWFSANIPVGATIYMKLNCEGAECDIIDDLLDSGFADRVASLYVDFDVRKVPGMGHRQAQVEERLNRLEVTYRTPDNVGQGAARGVARWLELDCARQCPSIWQTVRYKLRLDLPPYVLLTGIGRRLLPTRWYWWLGRRFGRLARGS